MSLPRKFFQIFVALLVLGGAAVAAWVLLKTARQTEPEDPGQAAKIVQVIELEPKDERIMVTAWGTVIPARELVVQAQVGGRVMSQHKSLVPGGRLSDGEPLLQIDQADYEMAVEGLTAEMEEAQYEFDLEKGKQVIARREWEQLKDALPDADIDPSLALREPHLRRTEAMVAKAENAIKRAKLDLERTSLEVPFNSMVIEESVEVGQLVEAGNDICRLVGTDKFWVRTTLPMADLNRIQLPNGKHGGAGADIHLDTGNAKVEPWSGEVVRLLADLEMTGRMSRILVEVEDPLDLASENHDDVGRRTPLLLGSYVRVEIEAGRLEQVLSIPRAALREGNRLWLVGVDNRIRIAEPEILWTRPETVLVENILLEGERLIVSELKAALPEMEVDPQLLDQEPDDASESP